MGFFTALTSILTTALPKVVNILKYAGQGIVSGIAQNGLAGYRLNLDGGAPVMDAYRVVNPFESQMRSLEGAISTEEADQEQVFAEHHGADRRQVIAGLIAAKEMNNAVLLSGLTNCKMEELTLEATPSFFYSRNAAPGEMKDGVPVIGISDHAYTHLIPKLFRNYEKLERCDAFCLQAIEVVSTQLTTNITGTTVAFYPLTEDTRKLDNITVKSAYNKQESGAYGRIAYMIRNVTPGTFTIEGDSFVPENFIIMPNNAIRTSFLKKYDAVDTDSEGSFLSYGTLCFIKENLGDAEVAMQFSIKLHFTVFRQRFLDPGDADGEQGGDGEDGGNDGGDGSDSAPSTTASKPITSNCMPKVKRMRKRGSE